MKIKLFIVLLFFCSQGFIAQKFVKTPSAATDISISPKDGSIFIVGTSKNVFKYDKSRVTFSPYAAQTQNIQAIAINPDGVVYMVSTSDEVHIDVNGRWIKIPGIKTTDIDIDPTGIARAIDASGRLKKLKGGKWVSEVVANKRARNFNQVAGVNERTVFARFQNSSFREFRNNKWTSHNGNPKHITLDNKTGDLYCIRQDNNIYRWDRKFNQWNVFSSERREFKKIAVHDGEIWALTENNSIYYHKPKVEGAVNPVTIDYSGTYRVTFKTILRNQKRDIYGRMGVYLETRENGKNTTIQPLDQKTNNVWDVSEGNPTKFKYLPVTIDTDQIINDLYGIINKRRLTTWRYGVEVDKIREFKIVGAAANEDVAFDFQFNVKYNYFFKTNGAWQRIKINITEVKLNYDYVYYDRLNGCAYVFNIEKR